MRFNLQQVRLFILFVFIALVSFVGGLYAGEQGVATPIGKKAKTDRTVPQGKDVDFQLFWQVWDRVESNYFDKSKINENEMVLGAIKGMVASLKDPYTVFLPPAEQKRTLEDLGGEFQGVGIQIGFRGSQLTVIAPLEGTPAQKAGVKAGDFIVGIKDKSKELEMGTVGLSLPDAVEAIRGPSGTKVTLVLTRKGKDEPFEVEVTRAKIEVPSVSLELVAQEKVAHLKLMRFGEQTNGEWDKKIAQIAAKNLKGVVLDLRNNPGGFLNGSVVIVSEFLPKGVVVIQEDGKGGRQELKVSGKARLPGLSLVVLVNSGSASASEIVAGALKDNGRAKIVGEPTFGKGTIQEAQEIDSSGLHITTARWLTPKGTWVNEKGLKPDIEVKDNPDTEEDEQLEKALELLK